jgi:hypothetical protein
MKTKLLWLPFLLALDFSALILCAGTPEQEKEFTEKYKKAFETNDTATLQSFLYTKDANPMALEFYKMMMTNGAGEKISKIELGQQIPTAADIHAWLAACSATAQQIQQAQTELQNVHSSRSALRQRSAIPAAGLTDDLPLTLADAFQLGYEAALADVRRQLGTLSAETARNHGSAEAP